MTDADLLTLAAVLLAVSQLTPEDREASAVAEGTSGTLRVRVKAPLPGRFFPNALRDNRAA